MLSGLLISTSLVQRNPNVTGDGLQYTTVVFNWLQGHGYRNLPNMTWLAEPGYGLLTYGIYLIVRDAELAGMLVSLIAYVLLIPAVYVTTRRLASWQAAWIAAFTITFYPYLITFSWLNLTDSVYTLFVFLCFSVYVHILLEGAGLISSICLGILLGCATLIRPEGYGITILAYASLWVVQGYETVKRKPQQYMAYLRAWRFTLLSGLVFILVVFPFVFFIYHISGSWVITPKINYLVVASQPSSAAGLLPLPNASATTHTTQPKAQEGIAATPPAESSPKRTTPLDLMPLSFERIGNNIGGWLSYFWMMSLQALLPLVMLALVYMLSDAMSSKSSQKSTAQRKKTKSHSKQLSTSSFWKQRGGSARDWKIILALAVFFATSGVYLTTNLMYRYLMPYMVYVLILISIIISHLLDNLQIRFSLKSPVMGMLLVGSLYLFTLSQPGTSFLARMFSLPNMVSIPQALDIKHLNLSARDAGIWMRENLDIQEDVFIASSKNTQNGCYLILFQLFNRELPIKGRCVSAFTQDEVNRFLQAGGDYYILDNDSINYIQEMRPLWENPILGQQNNLSLVYQDPQNTFQVYRSLYK